MAGEVGAPALSFEYFYCMGFGQVDLPTIFVAQVVHSAGAVKFFQMAGA